TGTDDAGGVFCHADVRVGGLAAATHSAAAAPLPYTIVSNAVVVSGYSYSSQSKRTEQILPSFDDRRVVDPDVTFTREHVDVRARAPRRARLVPVGIAERQVYARHFFILQQNADHVGQADVRAERKLADPVAVAVGMAVRPELVHEISAAALDARQTAGFNRQHHRRRLQVAVLRT